MSVAESGDAEFEIVFDGHDPFAGIDLVDQRSEQRGLPRSGSARNHEVQACVYCGTQESRDHTVHHTKVHELV